MSGTSGQAVKAAIIAALADAAGLETVQVKYSPIRDEEREWLYGGRVEMTQHISGGRNASGYTTRDETGTLELHIQVRQPGADAAEVESRAVVLGTALEEFLSLNSPAIASGTLDASVEGYTLTSYPDDDSWTALMTYRIAIQTTIL